VAKLFFSQRLAVKKVKVLATAVRMSENARKGCRILGACVYSEDRILLYVVGSWIIEFLIHICRRTY